MLRSKPLLNKITNYFVFIVLIALLIIYMEICNTGFSDLMILLIVILLGSTFGLSIVGLKLTNRGNAKAITFVFESLYIALSVLAAIGIVYLPISIITLITGHATLFTYIFFYSVIIIYPIIHIFNTINIIAKEHKMGLFEYIGYIFSRDKKEYKNRLLAENGRRIDYFYNNIEKLKENYQKRISRVLTVQDILSKNN